LISLIIEKLKGWSYYIPVNILILVISVSLLLGFMFSFLPAYFASKTNPVEAIKSE
jgi:ABC-type antimicrobial peptide transport system permease subunit